jgi:hypothetical protein
LEAALKPQIAATSMVRRNCFKIFISINGMFFILKVKNTKKVFANIFFLRLSSRNLYQSFQLITIVLQIL